VLQIFQIFKQKIVLYEKKSDLYPVQNESREGGGAVVEALRYKLEGRGIDSRWRHWNVSFT
jgi:hypothetical protein